MFWFIANNISTALFTIKGLIQDTFFLSYIQTSLEADTHLPVFPSLVPYRFSLMSQSLSEAQADLALDCCLTFSHKVIPKHVLLTYRRQFRVDGCPRDAVV